jgi:hypothetical protein
MLWLGCDRLLLLLLLQLLPDSKVSPGVRNLVPLALETVGIALWGVAAGAIQGRFPDQAAESWWRSTLEVSIASSGMASGATVRWLSCGASLTGPAANPTHHSGLLLLCVN